MAQKMFVEMDEAEKEHQWETDEQQLKTQAEFDIFLRKNKYNIISLKI